MAVIGKRLILGAALLLCAALPAMAQSVEQFLRMYLRGFVQ